MPIYKAKGKKDGLQKYNVRINYISDNGKAKQLTRTAYGSEAAKDLERLLINEIQTKGENSVKKMTMQELFNEYIDAKRNEVRESSKDKYKRNFELYVQPTMANVCLDKITVSMLQKWKLMIEDKGLALKTRQQAYLILNATLNYAVRMEYITRNPLNKLGTFKEAQSIKAEMGFYTADEFKRYISTIKKLAAEKQLKYQDASEWDYYVFFNITFYTGLRKGEIHALKWSDINGKILSVNRSITQKLSGGDRETAPKNKSSIRKLQIPLPLMKVLNEHCIRQEQLKNFTEEYRICGGEHCLRDSTLQKRNEQYAALSGLNKIRIHDFRHSHASVLINEGINIMEIARRLGHARIEETWNTYSHLYPQEEEKAIEVLNMIA